MPRPASSRCVTRVSSDATTCACLERLAEPSRGVAEIADGRRGEDDHGSSLRTAADAVRGRRMRLRRGIRSRGAATVGRMSEQRADARRAGRRAPRGRTDAPAAPLPRRPRRPPARGTARHAPRPMVVGPRLDPAPPALWYWGGPILVTLIAAVLRFWNLGHPQALVFDETYYVKDGWTLLHYGYESSWPEDADADFEAGDTDIFLDEPAVRRASAARQVDDLARHGRVRRRQRVLVARDHGARGHDRRVRAHARRPPPLASTIVAVIAGVPLRGRRQRDRDVAGRAARQLGHALRAARLLVRAARPGAAARLLERRLATARGAGTTRTTGPASGRGRGWSPRASPSARRGP